MSMSNIVAAHERLGNRLRIVQSWDHLADGATVLLLLISRLQVVVEHAIERGTTPDLVVASTSLRTAERDLQWLRDRGADSPPAISHRRLKMAWLKVAHVLSTLEEVQAVIADVA